MLTAEEQEERVIEPNTFECQLALIKTKSHGGCFHVTHEAHMTCDDLFIAVELLVLCKERAQEEKKSKLPLQLQAVEENELAILQQEKSVPLLNVKELGMLLAWHQA
jgi:hypothetical protein